MNDVRIRYSRHLMFNLSRPELSLILLAPLSREAGGYGICADRDAGHAINQPGWQAAASRVSPVFADKADPDYQRILALCREGKEHLETIKRFDMPGFRPLDSYLREMKRYGILTTAPPDDAIFDVYATDQAYWRSQWWQPR